MAQPSSITPEDLQDAEMVLRAEGGRIAQDRYGDAYARAAELGQEGRVRAIEGRISRDTETHVRRSMLRLARGATAGERPTGAPAPALATPAPPMPAPVPQAPADLNALLAPQIDYGRPQFTPISALPQPTAYDRPGYRPTSDIAATPQSSQEQRDLEESARWAAAGLNAAGPGQVYQSARAAREGRPWAAAGHAVSAALPYRPLAGLGALGLTYGGALAADLAPDMFGAPEAEAQQRQRQSAQPGALPPLPGLTPEQQARHDAAQRRIDTQNYGSGAERRSLEETVRELRGVSNDFIKAENSAKVNAKAQQGASAQVEYDRAVANAERIRDEELRRSRRFQDTNVGQVFDATGGYAPLVAGAATGALSRLATGGARNELYNYILPGVEGGAAGALTYNIPLAYDAFLTPVENPERRAYSAYARELPSSHPQRQYWQDYAQSLPEANPVRRNASQEFYDPGRMAERMIVGAGEGVLGGIAGASAVRTGARMIPGGPSTPAGPNPGRGTPGSAGGPPGGGGDLPGGGAGGPNNPLPPLDQRRLDPNFRLPANAPVAPGEVETWASPGGRNTVTRTPHGYRNNRGQFAPAPPPSYRRISQADEMPAEGLNALLG